MNVHGTPYRTIWIDDTDTLNIIDQTALPHTFAIRPLSSVEDVCRAISHMYVRGAGLIGATAAYGMWIAARCAPANENFTAWMQKAECSLQATRPTASNLAWALARQHKAIKGLNREDAIEATRREAEAIADEDALFCRRIGEHGLALIEECARKKGGPVHILTHCNAGWLAFVDHGSALSPIYAAHDRGIDVHVWVDETRPRNQGASLTAWELASHGVPHDLIVDNAGGHLMQHGMVDMVITGADRVARNGDAANKIGTYLKALAAADNTIPFYVAFPSSTLDCTVADGANIPIEERHPDEVRYGQGRIRDTEQVAEVLLCPAQTTARNWSFDVTPARLITGLITERGICPASVQGISTMFPDLCV